MRHSSRGSGDAEFTVGLFSIAVALLMLMAAVCAVSAAQRVTESAAPQMLSTYLKEHFGAGTSGETRYSYSRVDLSGHGPREFIVYLTGPEWCGTGGCTALVLQRQPPSFKVVSEIPITRLPITVEAHRSKGWHDIGVWVEGGGVEPGYRAVLRFDGVSYPTNPSLVGGQQGLKPKLGSVIVLSSQSASRPLNP